MVMVAQRVFASHKQCACTDSYHHDRHLQHCGTARILHHASFDAETVGHGVGVVVNSLGLALQWSKRTSHRRPPHLILSPLLLTKARLHLRHATLLECLQRPGDLPPPPTR